MQSNLKEKYMDPKTPENTLWIYSQLFIVFAFINIIMLAWSFADGSMNAPMLADAMGLSQGLVQGVVICVAALAVIEILMELYMGYKGIKQAQGKGKGLGHLVVAKIAAVVILITAIADAYSLFSNLAAATFSNWASLLTTLCCLAIIVLYHHAAKAVG